ncbi:MAG: hypothetical protein MPJ25_01695 [Pirellulales bacterium]|nr:hypothetical protein [Pirellulales bacterium]
MRELQLKVLKEVKAEKVVSGLGITTTYSIGDRRANTHLFNVDVVDYPIQDKRGRAYTQLEVVGTGNNDVSLARLYEAYNITSKDIIQAVKEYQNEKEPKITINDSTPYECDEFLVEVNDKEYWVLVQYCDGINIVRVVGDTGATIGRNFKEIGLGDYMDEEVIQKIYEYNE